MFFNKSALITIATIVAAIGNVAAQNPSFTGVCTFTITFLLIILRPWTVRSTYAYKSSSRADTQNLALDDELFAQFADPNTVDCISPVTYHFGNSDGSCRLVLGLNIEWTSANGQQPGG
ncbi:hypothetical protein K435DRAFT_801258 [Dendrothele bispora CBS 962.96]|uniref:Uncharacterized protein n=1 Tax=Dendrothele bispora (strain CBS 962.96) TaxID=1314807 RepID=A0A4V4HEK8_DENBC|nr:hypothetical protein K435DRAFT_801258 [Dendrothele bispora CBS 962.96]